MVTSFFLVIFLVLLFILGCFVVGIVLILKSRRGGPDYPACGQCGYNLIGTIGEKTRCPECGGNFSEVGIMPPKGKGKPLFLVLGIVLIVISLSCVGMTLFGFLMPRAVPMRAPMPPVPTTAPASRQTPPLQPAPGSDSEAGSDEMSDPPE